MRVTRDATKTLPNDFGEGSVEQHRSRSRRSSEFALGALTIALESLASGLVDFANELNDLSDVLDAVINADLDRIELLPDLKVGSGFDGHERFGSILTLRRRATGKSFCICVGVSTVPPFAEESEVVSWQFGIWTDGSLSRPSYVSAVYPLPASAGRLLVYEELRPAVKNDLGIFLTEAAERTRAFVSYVRENSSEVDKLCRDLASRGVATWKDRDDLIPGARWKDSIRAAIQDGSGFIACFSAAYRDRERSYMNEELAIAVEELRQRPRDRSWFFPVLLDASSEVPATPIGFGETLRDLQSVSLFADWGPGVDRLARAVRSAH